MIASVSPAVSASSRSSASTTTGWYYVQVPDLNTRTHRDIGNSKAGWTFTTICRLLHHIGRVGTPKARKAAKADQRLGVGLSAIATESGQSENKVRRDCRRLEELGLIIVTHPNVLMVRDAEGKLVRNRTGRSKAAVIHLTITQDHIRQTADKPSRMAGLNPSKLEGPPVTNSVHPGGAIQRDLNTERTPGGDAVGIGTPPAAGNAGLPAGEEPASILPMAAGRDEPAVPAGRILPAPRSAPPAPRPRNQGHGNAGQEQRRPAAEASAAWHRRDPERERQRSEYLAARAAKRAAAEAKARAKAETPPDAAEAAERLREALVDVPDERRDLIRREVVRQAAADDPEAAALASIIERRKSENGTKAEAGHER